MALRITDLMIGDWVRTEAGALIVAGVGHKIYCRANDGNPTHLWEVTSIDPIPLTADILYKNGFKDTDIIVVGHRRVQWSGDDGSAITIWMDDDTHMQIAKAGEILYLLPSPSSIHELQHALRLCGIEKEIIL